MNEDKITDEKVTTQKYIIEKKVNIDIGGFIVNTKWLWLSFRADGIVQQLKIIEEKCPFWKKSFDN